MSARNEAIHPKQNRKWIRWPLLIAPLPSLILITWYFGKSGVVHPMLYFGLLAYVLWQICCHRFLRKSVGTYVSGLLAGIPLIDWIVLCPIAMSPLFMVPAHGGYDYLELAYITVPPLAFLLALLLQRVAPAT